MKTHPVSLPNKLSVLSLAGCLLSALAPASTALAAPPVTVRASVSSSGAEGNNFSFGADISANGRLVAFSSFASNLVAGDNNGTWDVFVRDLKTGVTQRVSLDSAGTEGDNGGFDPALSANGRFVAFSSNASNLVAGDNNGTRDVFVRDLNTGVTQRVSLDSAGAEGSGFPALSASSFDPALSANGRLVAFSSDASNLVAADNNGTADVFVRNLNTGVTQRVSIDSAGIEGNSDNAVNGLSRYSGSTFPALSANGRFVAFDSAASNLVAADNNGTQDVFVRDLKTGVTQRVSLDSAGTEGNGFSFGPALSANGRFVAFGSGASNLVAWDSNGTADVFVHDLNTGVTQRVSLDSAGAEGNNFSFGADISANGRLVAFESGANNLVAGDHNFTEDVFVRDLKTGVTQRVSLDSAGAEGNSNSSARALSANGRFVAFDSDASNLVAGDTNGVTDVFVHRR